MDFELSEQQAAFRDLMRDFARKSISVASECEPRIPATPIQAFEISSKTTEYETASMAMPPYSSGTSMPNSPITSISSTISSG